MPSEAKLRHSEIHVYEKLLFEKPIFFLYGNKL